MDRREIELTTYRQLAETGRKASWVGFTWDVTMARNGREAILKRRTRVKGISRHDRMPSGFPRIVFVLRPADEEATPAPANTIGGV